MTASPVISLDDKYEIEQNHALVAGRQALVRLPIVQRELDKRMGLNTAGYIKRLSRFAAGQLRRRAVEGREGACRP